MATLGEHITKRRTELGLRPEHLAIALDVSVATIYNLESNKYIMRADKVLPLAKVLKMKAIELLELLEEADKTSASKRLPAGVA